MFSFWRSRPALSRAMAIVVVATFLPACSAWHTQREPVTQVVTSKELRRVRVIRQDGSRFQLFQPRIEGDSLVGTAAQGTPGVPLPRIAIALADVRAVELHEPDTGRTLLLAGVVGIAIVAIAAALADRQPKASPDTLHSSPHVYSFDGRGWRLESGTYAGAIARGVRGTDVTLLKHAAARRGVLELQVRNELNETDFLDAIAVLAVDHDSGVTIAPGPDGAPHAIGPLTHAVAARDDDGREVTELLASADDGVWESRLRTRDTANPRALTDGVDLRFTRPAGADVARLLVDARNTAWAPFMLGWVIALHGRATSAWYDSLSTDPAVAARYRESIAREGSLRVSVRKGDRWIPQGIVTDPGPEVTRRQVVPLDLTGVDGPTVRVRIESTPSLWQVDQVAIDYGPEATVAVHELPRTSATTTDGSDVARLVAAPDGEDWVFERGSLAAVQFRVPPLPPRAARSYLVRTSGWYRIHLPEQGEPDISTLDRVFREAGAGARLSVTVLNQALRVAAQPPAPR